MSSLHAWLYIHPVGEVRRQAMLAELADQLGLAPDHIRQSPNVTWLDTAGQAIKRSDVVQIIQELALSAFDTEHERWIIIHDANLLTNEAANALLKILEEPPPRTRLILLSPSAASVLPTLRSRAGLRVLSAVAEAVEPQAEAGDFVRASVAAKLGLIGEAHKAKRLPGLLDSLTAHLHTVRAMEDLAWLEEYRTHTAGQNLRLLLEAFALKEWQA